MWEHQLQRKKVTEHRWSFLNRLRPRQPPAGAPLSLHHAGDPPSIVVPLQASSGRTRVEETSTLTGDEAVKPSADSPTNVPDPGMPFLLVEALLRMDSCPSSAEEGQH